MAKKGNESVEVTNGSEPEYTVAELAAASDTIFGAKVMPECVTAALRVAKVKKTTVAQAQKIVNKFLCKEVRK